MFAWLNFKKSSYHLWSLSCLLYRPFPFSISFSQWILAGIRSPMGSSRFTTVSHRAVQSGKEPEVGSSSSCWRCVTVMVDRLDDQCGCRILDTGDQVFFVFLVASELVLGTRMHMKLRELESVSVRFHHWHVFILYPRDVPGLRGILQGDLPSRSWVLFPMGRSLP